MPNPTISDNGDGTVDVTFTWTTANGTCYDCGLPAAFFRGGDRTDRLCAVCAANAAVDGDAVDRLGAL